MAKQRCLLGRVVERKVVSRAVRPKCGTWKLWIGPLKCNPTFLMSVQQMLKPLAFVERSAGQYIPAVGKARPSGTDGPVLCRVCFGTLLAVDAPRGTHGTAAHVHAVAAGQGRATLILMPLHVALLTAHI